MGNGTEASKKALQFSSNVKKTALGVKFTRTLFTEPERLSTNTTTAVLKQLGLTVPKEITVGNDVAQSIVAGSAIQEGLEAGKNFSELQGPVNVTAQGIRSLTGLAEANGWTDSDSASTIRIGTNVAMLIGSAGTNVGAWLSLALELASTGAQKQGLADMNAILDAQEKYKARISPQSQILASTFKDFQEKNISIYGLIAKMAVETPDLWPQVINPQSPIVQNFPELMMLPVVGQQIVGRGSSEIWGDWPWPASGSYVLARWEGTKTIDFMTLGQKFDRESAARFFFELLLKPWMTVYSIANAEIVDRGNMDMASIAALTYLVKPDGEISDQYDYVNMLQGACLTPYDFGSNILQDISRQFVEDNYKGQDTAFHEQAVSSMLSARNITFNAYQNDKEIMRKKLEYVQENDDISVLVKYPYIYNKLQAYMDFQKTSFEKDPSYGGKLNQKFSTSSVRAWRKLHNYFAVLNLLNTFRTDSYLSQTHYAQSLMPFMPSIDSFDQTVQKISYLSTMRSANRLAKANIARLLGTTTEKLKRVSSVTEPGASKFTV